MKKKTVNLIVNIIVAVIFVLVLLITINIIASRGKGYTSIFGTAMVAVKSESMDGDQDTSFKKGDLIFVKVLKKDEDKASLKKDDVISFYDSNIKAINTHRIVDILHDTDENGNAVVKYQTKGDNSIQTDNPVILSKDVVGVYNGAKIGGVGNMFLFFQSRTGFLVCVVIPAILLVLYCAFEVFMSVRAHGKTVLADEKERMRAEILAEMDGKKEEEDDSDSDSDPDDNQRPDGKA